MTLNKSQIERYSRQIIVPKIGGIGQERLLAARMLILGQPKTIAPVTAYMTGAGVGSLFLRTPPHGDSATHELIERMRHLNPEVEITATRAVPPELTLIIALADSAATLGEVETLCAERWDTPIIFARLDSHPRIALIPSRPPCPRCSSADLLAPMVGRGETAPFVGMIAAVEAFKILTGYNTLAKPMLIEFNEYKSTVSELTGIMEPSRCGCAAPRDNA